MIVEILQTGNTVTAPTKKNLDDWIRARLLKFTCVIDPPSAPLASLQTYGRRENTWIVDTRTMKILRRVTGSTNGTGVSSTKQAIPYLLELLAKG